MAGHSAYAKERDRLLRHDILICLVTDQVPLMKQRKISCLTYTPPLYEQLKSIAHLSLGLAAAGLWAQEMSDDVS